MIVGDDRIRMHDTCENIDWIEACFVVEEEPDFLKSRCRYILEGGILKVIWSALVTMSGIKHSEQYELQGETVTNFLMETPDASTQQFVLWYMHLGYNSERSLKALSENHHL